MKKGIIFNKYLGAGGWHPVPFSLLQVALSLTRAVKFQRVSMEGGYNKENLTILAEQGKDLCTRLSLCARVVKASIPISK